MESQNKNGNIIAIITSGLLRRLGERRQELSGNGILVKSDTPLQQDEEKPVEFPLLGAGMLIACCFYLFASMLGPKIGIPGPVFMIIAATIVKALKLMPARMELGAKHFYRFVSQNLTWPLLVSFGIVIVPWKSVVDAITPSYIAICVSTVLAMIASGFFVAKFLRMYPVETAIVCACHSGLGGTGDVAILSASNRMELMPFAQVATRLGGASMVVTATLLLRMFNG